MWGAKRAAAVLLTEFLSQQFLSWRQVSHPTVHRLVLRELLNPRQWRPADDRKFALDAEQINELCDTAERILKDEPSVLRLRGGPPAGPPGHARKAQMVELRIVPHRAPPHELQDECIQPSYIKSLRRQRHGSQAGRLAAFQSGQGGDGAVCDGICSAGSSVRIPELCCAEARSAASSVQCCWRGSQLKGLGAVCCAAPIKIFGDLHGQFGDLMRLFEEYGTPSTAGDITYIDYLFLVHPPPPSPCAPLHTLAHAGGSFPLTTSQACAWKAPSCAAASVWASRLLHARYHLSPAS